MRRTSQLRRNLFELLEHRHLLSADVSGVDDFVNEFGPDLCVFEVGQQIEGRIDFVQDEDVFAIRTQVGQWYEVIATEDGVEAAFAFVNSPTNERIPNYGEISTRILFRAGETGNHVISIVSRNLGNYSLIVRPVEDDHTNEISDNLAKLVVNENQTGVFEHQNDIDVFAFEALDGEVYEFATDQDGTSDFLVELAAEGSEEPLRFGGGLQWKAPETGTYYVTAYSSSRIADNSNYEIGVTLFDDDGDSLQSAIPIQTSSVEFAELEPVGDIDWFSVDLQTGRSYEVFATSPDFEKATTSVRLFDGDRNELLADRDPWDRHHFVYSPASPGTHYLQLSTQSSTAAGSYTLWGRELRDSVISIEAEPADAQLQLGAPSSERPFVSTGLVDTMEATNSHDIRVVEGNHFYVFEVVPLTAALPTLTLIDPSADEILARTDDFHFTQTPTIVWPADRSGVFRLDVGARQRPGSYELRVSVFADAFADDVDNSALPVPYDTTIISSLENIADADYIPFDAVEGEHYELTFAIENVVQRNETFQILNALGESSGWINTSGLTHTWEAPESGRFYLALRSREEIYGTWIVLSDNQASPYHFRIRQFNDDHGDIIDESATPIAVEQEFAGVIEHTLDNDVFVFAAEAGVAYRAEYSAGAVQVFDPNGELVRFFITHDAPFPSWNAQTSGNYNVVVKYDSRAFLPATTPFEYGLTVRVQSDDHPDFRNQVTTTIDVDATIEATLETFNDTDVFAIETEAGQGYELTATSNPNFFGFQVEVLEGNDAVEPIRIGSDKLTWKATETGTTYLRFSLSSSIPTADYEFQVVRVDDDWSDIYNDASPILTEDAVPIAGHFEIAEDVDAFGFDAVAGRWYAFDTQARNAWIRSVDGQVIEELRLGNRYWKANESGRFVFAVRGFADSSYEVSMSSIADDHVDVVGEEATPLLHNEIAVGTIQATDDVDLFRVTMNAGDEYAIVMGTNNHTTTVLDDSGNVFSRLSSGQVSESGVYFLRVSQFSSFPAQPSYTLSFASGPDQPGNTGDANSPILVPNEKRLGAIGGGDVDVWAFEANVGDQMSITLDPGTARPTIRVLAPNGRTEIRRNLVKEWTSSTSGLHFVEITRQGGRAGSYGLTLQRIPAEPALSRDVDSVFANLQTLHGDTDLDGDVDFADFLQLSSKFGSVGELTDGDSNGDGRIDFTDFLILSQNFGRVIS